MIEAWFVKLYRQLESITAWPKCYPVDEVYSEALGRESRKISYRDHVVIYQVDESEREVVVVAFVHGASRG